jgi:spore coat polysaccharide biosynthesis predicted glycosyltransferase SpsG
MSALLILTEGGESVGLGHLRRCVALAVELRELGAEVEFRVAGGKAAETFVNGARFPVTLVPDLKEAGEAGRPVGEAHAGVIVDSYAVREEFFRACSGIVVAIDDLADRTLPVDLVVNPAIAADPLGYRGLTDALLLVGPRYSLLQREFRMPPMRVTRKAIERILVTLGGGDHRDLERVVTQWCHAALPDATIELVSGPFSRRGEEPVQPGGVVVLDQPDMRAAMLRADVALCGGGQTLFELAATGTPAVVLQTAANQARNIAGFVTAGTIHAAGSAAGEGLTERLEAAFEQVRDAETRDAMSRRGPALVDGYGAKRVAEMIVKLCGRPESAKR